MKGKTRGTIHYIIIITNLISAADGTDLLQVLQNADEVFEMIQK